MIRFPHCCIIPFTNQFECSRVCEIHFAVYDGVPVKMCTYISPEDLYSGRLNKDTCVTSAKFSVDSAAARCRILGQPQRSDKIMIRKVIDKSVNGYNVVNQSVEDIRLSYLVKYTTDRVYSNLRS